MTPRTETLHWWEAADNPPPRDLLVMVTDGYEVDLAMLGSAGEWRLPAAPIALKRVPRYWSRLPMGPDLSKP